MSRAARIVGLCITAFIWSVPTGNAVPLSVGLDPAFIAQQQENSERIQQQPDALMGINDASLFKSGDTVNVLCTDDIYTLSSGGGTDCWGYEAPDGTEYAIMGTAGGVTFVNVTAGQVVTTVPQSPCGASWRDMATWGQYCYVVSECTGTNQGLMVIDMSFLPDSVHLVNVINPSSTGGTPTSHNLSIDSINGYIYTEGSSSGFDQVRIHDLSNPANPTYVSTFGTGSNGSIHDFYVYDDTLYLAEGRNPFWSIWDMADKMAPQLIVRVAVPNPGYVHNIWPSDDRQHLVTTEETVGKTVKVWDISNLGNVQLVGQYLAPSSLAHNAHMIGDTIYLSHYESGVRVVDISNPAAPNEIFAYDTYTADESGNFNGCWGAFPFTNSGRIYGSNLDGRLFILSQLSVILADTISASEEVAIPGSQVRIDISATNSVEVKQFIIPINFGGPYNLTFDSASVAGLRTEYFDNFGQAGFDPFNSRMSYVLSVGNQALLPPGTGPIMSIYFTVPPGASGPSNPITFTPYSQFAASFNNVCVGGYLADTVSGAVTLGSGCCVGLRGNIDGDGLDEVNVADLTYLVGFAYKSGATPPCLPEANVNGDPGESIDVSDLTALVSYMFKSGPPPAICN